MKKFFKYTLSFLLFGAHLLSASNGVETDSSKKYPITDPRNPNCPCHQYQKQADIEYARLLKKPGGQEVNLEASNAQFGETKRVKKVRSNKWFFGYARNHKTKAPKKKRFRDKLSRCFHF